MERYRYEPGAFSADWWSDKYDEEVDEQFEKHHSANSDGYLIFDKLRGHMDDKAIAFTTGRDTAETIVKALNLADKVLASVHARN